MVDLNDKMPLHSKKWTAFMWIHTTLTALLFYLVWVAAKDMIVLTVIAILGGLDMLYLGGVYALDKYKMGLVEIIQAVKSKQLAKTPPEMPGIGEADAPTDLATRSSGRYDPSV